MRFMTITKDIGPLECLEFNFTMIDNVIYLESACHMTRPSPRHMFRVNMEKSYARLDQRGYGIKVEPDVPIEISSEAVQRARQNITFKKWDRFK